MPLLWFPSENSTLVGVFDGVFFSTESTGPPLLAVLVQANNVWTRSSDSGSGSRALAETQPNHEPQGNRIQEKRIQQHNVLTFMYQRMGSMGTHTSARAYLGLPFHFGATGFWRPVCCLLWCMSVWLCLPPWQAWWIPWFQVVLELLRFPPPKKERVRSHMFSQSATGGLRGWTTQRGSTGPYSDHAETDQVTQTHLEQWGRLWWSWQAWWRASRCTGPRPTGSRRWFGWSAPAMTPAPARFCGPSTLRPGRATQKWHIAWPLASNFLCTVSVKTRNTRMRWSMAAGGRITNPR